MLGGSAISNIKCKATYSIKTETHTKHGNQYNKEKWSFHVVSKEFIESLTK